MKIKAKALGQTVEQDGDVSLVVAGDGLPPDCMVIFIAIEDWEELKSQVYLSGEQGEKK